MLNLNMKTNFSMLTRSQMHEAREIAKLIMYEDSKREQERLTRQMNRAMAALEARDSQPVGAYGRFA